MEQCSSEGCKNLVSAQQKCWECGKHFCNDHLELCSRCQKWKVCGPQCAADHRSHCVQNLPNLGPLKPEKVIGKGGESVYVWYPKSEFESETLKENRTWACKIGRTKGDVTARLIAQGSYTAFHSDPIVALVIQTENSQALEYALHSVLEYAGKRITNSRGTEWFKTNPQEVEVVYNALNRITSVINSDGSQD